MKKLLITIGILGVLSAQAQAQSEVITVTQQDSTGYTTLTSYAKNSYVSPNLSNTPHYGDETFGTPVIDTVPLILITSQIRTSKLEYNSGTLRWENGYYVASKNIYLDVHKKPLSSLYRVFSTMPRWK